MSNPNPDTRYSLLAAKLRGMAHYARQEVNHLDPTEADLIETADALDALIAENARLRSALVQVREDAQDFVNAETLRTDVIGIVKDALKDEDTNEAARILKLKEPNHE